MNYDSIYCRLISRAKNQNRQKLDKSDINYIYYELHHIIPKCIQPEFKNLKKHLWNGVLLTPEEHYLAHLLLVKMHCYKNDDNYNGLIYGAHRMCCKSPDHEKRGNKLYGWLKRVHAISLSLQYKGISNIEKYGEERAKEISIAKSLGQTGKPHKGHPCSEETKMILSNRKISEETRKNMSKARKGKSWNDILGEDKANKMRKERQIKYSGLGNPASDPIQYHWIHDIFGIEFCARLELVSELLAH